MATSPDEPLATVLATAAPTALVVRRQYSEENEEQQELVRCPSCGADDTDPVLETKDWLMGKPGRYTLVRCRSCELTYLNPRPALEALGAHYPDNYFCYTNFEGEHPILARGGAAMQRTLSRARLRYLEHGAGHLAPKTKIVDVGCGRGDLLDFLRRERGCDVLGIDFNEKVTELVRDRFGIEALHGTLQSANFEAGRFDVVTMCEYLEHEPNPRAVLEEAHRVLRPGGAIGIEVPDISGRPSRLFKSRWWQLDAPRHLILFTPQTLGALLERTGFEVVRVQHFGRIASMGYSLLQAFGWSYARANHVLYLALANLLGLPFAPFLRFLPDFMFVVARKRAEPVKDTERSEQPEQLLPHR